MATVQLQGVTRSFGDLVALRDLDLTLEAGRIYGLLGPNGSGKTTTLRAILGLMRPDRGTVTLFGGPPDDGRRARIGYIPEMRAVPPESRVRETLVFFARMRGRTRPDAKALADTWIERLELAEKADERIKTLSNGQQQKVQVALALMCGPELVLADEPLTALDPNHQDLVTGALEHAASEGATIVLSTHRLREAEHFVEHVVMLAEGRKVMDKPLQTALDEAFAGVWQIRVAGEDGWIAGPEVASVVRDDDMVRIELAPGATLSPLLARAAEAGAPLHALEAVVPSLHELYLKRVGSLGIDAGDVA